MARLSLHLSKCHIVGNHVAAHLVCFPLRLKPTCTADAV